jgi:hypothetical protein
MVAVGVPLAEGLKRYRDGALASCGYAPATSIRLAQNLQRWLPRTKSDSWSARWTQGSSRLELHPDTLKTVKLFLRDHLNVDGVRRRTSSRDGWNPVDVRFGAGVPVLGQTGCPLDLQVLRFPTESVALSVHVYAS